MQSINVRKGVSSFQWDISKGENDLLSLRKDRDGDYSFDTVGSFFGPEDIPDLVSQLRWLADELEKDFPQDGER